MYSEPLLRSMVPGPPINSPIFGAKLEDAIQISHIPGKPLVPAVLYRCAVFLEAKGIDEVGLYRVPGSHANVQRLRKLFDTGKDYDLLAMKGTDPNDIATLLKLYLRECLVFAPTLSIGSVLFKALLGGYYDGVDNSADRYMGLRIVWGGLLQDVEYNVQEWSENEVEDSDELQQFGTGRDHATVGKEEYIESDMQQHQYHFRQHKDHHNIYHQRSMSNISPFSDHNATSASLTVTTLSNEFGPLNLEEYSDTVRTISNPFISDDLEGGTFTGVTRCDELSLMNAMLLKEETATKTVSEALLSQPESDTDKATQTPEALLDLSSAKTSPDLRELMSSPPPPNDAGTPSTRTPTLPLSISTLGQRPLLHRLTRQGSPRFQGWKPSTNTTPKSNHRSSCGNKENSNKENSPSEKQNTFTLRASYSSLNNRRSTPSILTRTPFMPRISTRMTPSAVGATSTSFSLPPDLAHPATSAEPSAPHSDIQGPCTLSSHEQKVTEHSQGTHAFDNDQIHGGRNLAENEAEEHRFNDVLDDHQSPHKPQSSTTVAGELAGSGAFDNDFPQLTSQQLVDVHPTSHIPAVSSTLPKQVDHIRVFGQNQTNAINLNETHETDRSALKQHQSYLRAAFDHMEMGMKAMRDGLQASHTQDQEMSKYLVISSEHERFVTMEAQLRKEMDEQERILKDQCLKAEKETHGNAEQIKDLKVTIQRLQESCQDLSKDRDNLRATCSDLNQSSSKLQEEWSLEKQGLLNKFSELQYVIDEGRRRYQQQADEILGHQEKNVELQQSLEDKDKKLHAQIKLVEKQEQTITLLVSEAEKVKDSLEKECKMQIRANELECQSFLSKVECLETKLCKAEADLTRTLAQLSASKDETMAVERRYNVLVQDTKKPSVASINVGTADNPECDSYLLLVQLQRSFNAMKSENDEMTSVLASSKAQLGTVLKDNLSLAQALKVGNKENTTRTDAELVEQTQRQENMKLNNQISVVNSECQRLQSANNILQEDIGRLQLENERLKESKVTHATQMDSIIKDYTTRFEDIRMRDKVESQNQIQKNQYQLRELESNLEQKITEHAKEKEDLEREWMAKIEDLKSSYHTEISNLQDRIKELQDTSAAAQSMQISPMRLTEIAKMSSIRSESSIGDIFKWPQDVELSATYPHHSQTDVMAAQVEAEMTASSRSKKKRKSAQSTPAKGSLDDSQGTRKAQKRKPSRATRSQTSPAEESIIATDVVSAMEPSTSIVTLRLGARAAKLEDVDKSGAATVTSIATEDHSDDGVKDFEIKGYTAPPAPKRSYGSSGRRLLIDAMEVHAAKSPAKGSGNKSIRTPQ
ncbi:hypothetical protein BGZ51_005971 [Haplosporangium sp. Z 767]|nr:hypothetical protein BGZ51_005971 [Haplosporangium sp. Z 767]